jgi:DNA-binding transcriptional LysR family regulator
VNLDESSREQLATELLLRCAYCLVYPKHRWPTKRGTPELSDFRDDNFLSFLPDVGGDYESMVRTVCRLDSGFEPKFLPVANDFESLISMATAGRGVFLAAKIAVCYRNPSINFHVLKESKNQFELYVIQKKDSEPPATVNNFVRILFEVVRPLANTAGEALGR